MPHLLSKLAVASFALAAAASFSSANAAPHPSMTGVAAAGDVQPVTYRHYYRHAPYYGGYDDGRQAYAAPPYAYRYYGYSDEIHELRRLYPETNWPPSQRY